MNDVIAFVRSVVDHLPSSSAGSENNPNVTAFGEVLVDIIWAIDSELEEILGDAKATANAAEQGTLSATTVAQAVKAKGNAESDKETLVLIVRRLLVRVIVHDGRMLASVRISTIESPMSGLRLRVISALPSQTLL